MGGGLDVLAQLGQTQPRRVVCLRVGAVDGEAVAQYIYKHTRTHTHTHIHIFIYMCLRVGAVEGEAVACMCHL